MSIRRTCQTAAFLVLAAGIISCGFRSVTTPVVGTVRSEGKPVAAVEVRVGVVGNEATTTTNLDGRFYLTVRHSPSQELELKVLKPGFVHDEIKFFENSGRQREFEIELKRVFTPPSK